jgi:hypothetical protein
MAFFQQIALQPTNVKASVERCELKRIQSHCTRPSCPRRASIWRGPVLGHRTVRLSATGFTAFDHLIFLFCAAFLAVLQRCWAAWIVDGFVLFA